MSYVKAITTERLPLPSDPAYYVDWKSYATYGDIKKVSSAALSTSARGEQTVDNSAAADQTLLLYIADWNLDDATGAKLPLTPESLNFLADVDANFLSQKAAERMNATGSDRKN